MQKVETIKDLVNNIRWEEDILHERMKKGTITADDKKSKRYHISKLQNYVKLESTLLDTNFQKLEQPNQQY